MLLKVKKVHPDAPDLKRAHRNDSGYDLYATTLVHDSIAYVEYGTGISIQLQEGTTGLICARSSISKYDLDLANSIGVLDSSYTGEIRLRFRKLGLGLPVYKLGDKIGQLIIVRHDSPDFMYVQELDKTERGDGGFGSSGT